MSENLTREQAIEVVGLDAVNKVDGENCEPLFCSKCGGEWSQEQQAFWDPRGGLQGRGWHKDGYC